MKAIVDTKLHRWPDSTRRKPGPRQKFTKTFMVRTTDAQAKQMEDRADEEDISVAQLVRSAIEEYLMGLSVLGVDIEFHVYGSTLQELEDAAMEKAAEFFRGLDHGLNLSVHVVDNPAKLPYVAHVRAFKKLNHYDD